MAETLLTDRVGLADRKVRAMPARSEEELAAPDVLKADQAKEALLCSRIYTLRSLFVEQDGESVVLRGHVESFYHKQLAQELVRAAIEGVEVVNRINVVYGRDKNVTGVDW